VVAKLMHDKINDDPVNLAEWSGGFDIAAATAANEGTLSGSNPLCVVTPSQQWAYAAIWPLRDDPNFPLTGETTLIVRIEATVENGCVGVSVASEDLREFMAEEVQCGAASGRNTIEILVPAPRSPIWLVVRNTAAGGIMSRVLIHSIKTHLVNQQLEAVVWIDVGAHLGEKTLSIARHNPNLRVYAFEPNLRVAVRLMGRLANYVVLPIAIAEHDGSAPFYVNRCEAASSLLPLVPEGLTRWVGGEDLSVEDTLNVPTLRLETFLNRAGISKVAYLKIDAQGADLAVIRSAGERLRDIERISLEVQTTVTPLYRNASTREDTIAFLAAAGFELISCEKQSHDQEENLTFERPSHGIRNKSTRDEL
jgi:FkbM family methyltransferase